MRWIEVKITTTSDGTEAVCGRLYRLGIKGVQIEDYRDFADYIEKNNSVFDYIDEKLLIQNDTNAYVKAYVNDNDLGNDIIVGISQSLRELKMLDQDNKFGSLEMTLSGLNEEDWANNWKKHYKPFKIGEKILIKPEWESYKEETDRIIFNVNPGMMFGTGTHESTRLCLEAAEKYVKKEDIIVDVGCGSGILSIISLLLGAKRAVAIDIDPNVTDIAYKNAKMNGIDNSKYEVLVGDIIHDACVIGKVGENKYNLAFANIVADAIIDLASIVYRFLKVDGIFVCSGIIDEREKEVRDALKNNGFAILESKLENAWVCIVCQKKC